MFRSWFGTIEENRFGQTARTKWEKFSQSIRFGWASYWPIYLDIFFWLFNNSKLISLPGIKSFLNFHKLRHHLIYQGRFHKVCCFGYAPVCKSVVSAVTSENTHLSRWRSLLFLSFAIPRKLHRLREGNRRRPILKVQKALTYLPTPFTRPVSAVPALDVGEIEGLMITRANTLSLECREVFFKWTHSYIDYIFRANLSWKSRLWHEP